MIKNRNTLVDDKTLRGKTLEERNKIVRDRFEKQAQDKHWKEIHESTERYELWILQNSTRNSSRQ